MDELLDFAGSVPDFRRTGKGNHRHVLAHIIALEVLARLSKCVSRADVIKFGETNLRKFQSMGMLQNGVPSEPTMSRVSAGIDHEAMARCRKKADRKLGATALMRRMSARFSALMRFLSQKKPRK